MEKSSILNDKITKISISSGFFPRDKPSEIPFSTASKTIAENYHKIWRMHLENLNSDEKANKKNWIKIKVTLILIFIFLLFAFTKDENLTKLSQIAVGSSYTFLAAKRIGELFNQKKNETLTEKLTKEPSLEIQVKEQNPESQSIA